MPECVEVILEDFIERHKEDFDKGVLDKVEIASLADYLGELREKYRNIGDQERLDKIMNKVLALKDEEMVVKTRAKLLNLKRQNARVASIKHMSEKGGIDLVEAFEADMVGSSRAIEGAGASADAHIKSTAGKYIGALETKLRKLNLFERFLDKDDKLYRDYCIEANALTESNRSTNSVTGNIVAKQIADIVDDISRDLMSRSNESGAWLKYRNNYTIGIHHDAAKIRFAGMDEWVSFVKDRLDLVAMYDKADIDLPNDEWLQGLYKDLSEGRANHDGFDADAHLGGRETASKMSKSRKLIWKSGEDMYLYNKKFGMNKLSDAILHGINSRAKKIGLMEYFGPDPVKTFNRVLQYIDGQGQLTLKNKRMLENRFTELTNANNIPIDKMLGKISANARALKTASGLGSAFLSATVDPGVAATEFAYQGIGLIESIWRPVENIFKGKRKGVQREIAASLGVYVESLLGHMHARLSATDGAIGQLSKTAERVLKLSGLTWLTDAGRAGAVLTFAEHLGRNSKTLWKDLNSNLQRVLKRYHIEEGRWDVLRKYASVEADGRVYLTPDHIERVSSEEIKQMMRADKRAFYKNIVEKGISDYQVAEYRKALDSDLRGYFMDSMNKSVITPGAKEFSIMRQGTEAGTWKGEIFRALLQFRSYSVAFTTKVLGREIYGRSGANRLTGLAGVIAITTVYGALAEMLQELATGKVPAAKYVFKNDMKQNLELFGRAIIRGGGAGIYGDFLNAAADNYDKGMLPSLAGPLIGGTAVEGATIFADTFKAMKGDRRWRTVGKDLTKFVKHNTPGINLWYTKAILDYAVYYKIMDTIDPGYKRRLDRRIRKETNQRNLFD